MPNGLELITIFPDIQDQADIRPFIAGKDPGLFEPPVLSSDIERSILGYIAACTASRSLVGTNGLSWFWPVVDGGALMINPTGGLIAWKRHPQFPARFWCQGQEISGAEFYRLSIEGHNRN